MNTNDDQELTALVKRWRAFVAAHHEPAPEPTVDEVTALFQQHRHAAPPPVRTLPVGLQNLLDAWQTTWTEEMRTHPDWPTTKNRLATVRQWLTKNRLVHAEMELQDIVGQCCPSAHAFLHVRDRVRALDPTPSPYTEEELHAGFAAVLAWFETL